MPESDLEQGQLRMLEVDNRVIIPELTHTRIVISAADVISQENELKLSTKWCIFYSLYDCFYLHLKVLDKTHYTKSESF